MKAWGMAEGAARPPKLVSRHYVVFVGANLFAIDLESATAKADSHLVPHAPDITDM